MPQPKRQIRKRRCNRSVKRSKPVSFLGNVLLEVIAVAAFLALLSISKHSDGSSPPMDKVAVSGSSEFGSLVTGFVADQVDRHQLFSGK